jgi:hypothetical protein
MLAAVLPALDGATELLLRPRSKVLADHGPATQCSVAYVLLQRTRGSNAGVYKVALLLLVHLLPRVHSLALVRHALRPR